MEAKGLGKTAAQVQQHNNATESRMGQYDRTATWQFGKAGPMGLADRTFRNVQEVTGRAVLPRTPQGQG